MILNIKVDHKTADVSTIEKSFYDMDNLLENIKKRCCVHEYLQMKTCNRAELYLVLDDRDYIHDLEDSSFVIETDDDALRHLLRLTSGLESMMVGEDQILGQVKDAYKAASRDGCVGQILRTTFTKSIHVGQVVRKKTNINKGSVSIGSAAVELAESVHGDLKCKKVLVIGAGKMGTLAAKALAEKKLKAIVVANRTYKKAVKLAKELGGYAIHFDRLDDAMADADVVISATGAPHLILTYDRVKGAVLPEKLKNMVMVDVANPHDIDKEVAKLGVKLFDIDDLRGIAAKNKKMREAEAEDAKKILEGELQLLKRSLKHLEVEPLISDIRKNVERIRIHETKKALKMLGNLDGREKIVDDLTQVVVDKIFHDVIKNIRDAAAEDDKKVIEAAWKIFARENKLTVD